MNRDPAPHEVLGVRPGASVPEITSAYRRLALQLHPDMAPQVETAALFSAVTEAYHALLADRSVDPRPERGVPVPRPARELTADTGAAAGRGAGLGDTTVGRGG